MVTTSFAVLEDGKKVRFARLGSGHPLIFLHGYPENLHIWDRVIEGLSDDFECIAFDWPGMGESDAWVGGTTPMHMANRLLKLLDQWGIKKATLVGMDMGGQPALAFAAKYHERISELVVMNSLVIWDENTSWEIALLRKYGLNRIILRYLPRIVFRRAERTFLPRGQGLTTELREDFWKSFKRAEVREFIMRMCAGYQGTLSRLPDLYAKIETPTLILWAEKDAHFPLAHGQRLQALIPDSRLEIISGAGHWMAWHAAPLLVDQIRRFADQFRS